MSVIRVHKNKNFTVMSNIHLRDMDLSLKAKGLLSVMLSLPDNWNYSIAGLCSICKENETAIKSTIKELKEKRYVIVDKKNPNETESKKYEYIYNIFEEPQEENQASDYQGVENLPIDNPPIENRPLNKRNNKSNIDKINTNTNKNISSKANSFFAKKVADRNKITNPPEINQSELINRINKVADRIGEEVFTEEQTESIKSCMIYFVEKYARVFSKKHPILGESAINDVIANITRYAYAEHENFTTCFDPLVSEHEDDEAYKEIIDMYFKTEFKQDIDYSIVHFSQKNVLIKLMGKATEKTWFTNE